MIKAILFDLDGTLVNTLGDLAYGVNSELEKYGFPTHKPEAFKLFAGNGIPVMVQRAAPKDIDEKLLKQITEAFVGYYTEHYADYTEIYEGIPELLTVLQDRGYILAVVTNKAQAPAELVINQFFGDTFNLIFGQKAGIPPKPDPTAALLAMKELGVEPNECVFLGDSGVDIKTGANSGAYPVGVLWGFRDKAELEQNGAAEIISNPLELLDIIERKNKE